MAAAQLLTHDDCQRVAARALGRADVRVISWKEAALGDKPAGYLGDHKLVTIHASTPDGARDVFAFAKATPLNETQAELVQRTKAFRKEFLFYSEVVSKWEETGIVPKKTVAQRCKEPEDCEVPMWRCPHYLVREDLIVLENAATLGFSTFPSRRIYNYEEVLLVVKMLASFHSATIIYEEERSKELGKPYRIGEALPEMVAETFYIVKDGHPGEKTTEAGVFALSECAKKLQIYRNGSEATRRAIDERLPGVLRRVYESVRASPRFRNVLCHSDLWQNNILFRAGTSDAPLSALLVDFQLLRWAPPAHDVFSLLHLTLRLDARRRHEAALLDAYCATLAAALARRGLDAERVFPRAQWSASLAEQRFAGRLAAVFCLHFVLVDERVLKTVFASADEYARAVWDEQARARMVSLQFEADEEYRERIEECLTELIEEDVLA